jgi:hypothetical protein
VTVVDLQRPRVATFPAGDLETGREAVELAAWAGLVLDPWQAFVLEHALAERPDGKWASFEVGVVVPRQNGKGSILEARELAGLFLLDERLIIHSAHQFDTSLEAFRRLLALIEAKDDLRRRVKRVSRAHGEEGIELLTGQRVRFRTRTKGGGRGFTGDTMLFDEAMILPETAHGALMPTMSARPNPQAWYLGSAVDQVVHDHGVVFSRVRGRGIRRKDPSLAFFEWSAHPEGVDDIDPSDLPLGLAEDPASWRAANPAAGIRISEEHIERERRSMDPRTFAVERLGIGDWPETDPDAGSVIPIALWRELADARSAISERLCLALDVNPERSSTSIAAGGLRRDELAHVEVVERHPGTGWVVQRLAELNAKHRPSTVLVEANSPAASLVADLQDAGVQVTVVPSSDLAKACGVFFDLVQERRVRHLGAPELDSAVRGAAKRPLVDSWAWSRKTSKVDISPLVAATLAAWHATAHDPNPFIL